MGGPTKDTQIRKTRLKEIEHDMIATESFFWKHTGKDTRKAINKLRYLLIVEKHSLEIRI